MPLIEELPISQSHRVTHGWAYVPDTGAPTIAAVQPGNRKRNRDNANAAATASATLKQQKAAQARLDSLDKENFRDGVSVPIPARVGAEKKREKKMTVNVRRILTYQRGFAHYLADEEANATVTQSTAQQQGPSTTGRTDTRRKSNVNESPTVGGARRGRPPAADKEKQKAKDKEKMLPPPKPVIKQEEDTTMTDAPSTSQPTSTPTPTPTLATPTLPKPTYDPELDTNPLLRTTNLPKMPSSRVMSLLLAEPPLSYTASRAKLSGDELEKPTRRFCAICGYWGKVKCKKCAEWTCGILECWRGHEGVCPAVGVF